MFSAAAYRLHHKYSQYSLMTIEVTVWTDRVFKVSGYPVESLEIAVSYSDPGIINLQPDDKMMGQWRAESYFRS